MRSLYNRPKLKISIAKVNQDSVEVEINNTGKFLAVNCYVRITLRKQDDDVIDSISISERAFITTENKSVKIFKDYVAWAISPNPARISIPQGLSDRALICEVDRQGTSRPGESKRIPALKIASENAYVKSRVFLKAYEIKKYSGTIVYGADNCRPKETQFEICFIKDKGILIPKMSFI